MGISIEQVSSHSLTIVDNKNNPMLKHCSIMLSISAMLILFSMALTSCGGASTKQKQQQLSITSSTAIAGFEVTFQKPLPSSVQLKFDSIAAPVTILNRLTGDIQEYLVYLPKTGLMPLVVVSNPVFEKDIHDIQILSIKCVDRAGNDVVCNASWMVLKDD